MVSPAPVRLFYSYSHRDSEYRDELASHLALLRRRGLIDEWHDRRIEAGRDWSSEIEQALRDAHIVLLLVSSDFMASDYCFGNEMTAALERHQQGLAEVVPVIIRAVDWQDAPFSHLQALPNDDRPVASWGIRDEAWTVVAKGIRKVVERIRPVAAPAEPGRDDSSEIDRAVTSFVGRIQKAAAAKHITIDSEEGEKAGQQLASVSAPKSVLWVDDHPTNNVYEMSALFALQIDIETAISTEAALDLLDRGASYDLIISDWNRDPQEQPGLPEGVRLLEELQRRRSQTPVVMYHGGFAHSIAEYRDRQARSLGAIGATAYPDALLRWCVEALRGA